MFFARVVSTRKPIGFREATQKNQRGNTALQEGTARSGKMRRNAVGRTRMEGGGETYPTTVFFISDQGATNHLTTTRTVLEHLQHLQATPSGAKQQALKDSWGSLPAGGTANS